MRLNNVFSQDEVGFVSLLLDDEWENGVKSFYLYWCVTPGRS